MIIRLFEVLFTCSALVAWDLTRIRYVPRLAKPQLLEAATLGIAITSATSTQNLKEPQYSERVGGSAPAPVAPGPPVGAPPGTLAATTPPAGSPPVPLAAAPRASL